MITHLLHIESTTMNQTVSLALLRSLQPVLGLIKVLNMLLAHMPAVNAVPVAECLSLSVTQIPKHAGWVGSVT